MTRPQNTSQAALSAALSGAVDLSALKARADASRNAPATPDGQQPAGPREAAAPAAANASPYIIDVTEETFQADVVERSMQAPVVLDLWATWCEPCKQLSPILERLAVEGEGSWILAKVDVDQNQRIAQGLGVQGIPAIKAIFQGQMIAEFNGVQPEDKVREFLKAIVEAAGGALPAGAEPPEDPRLAQAEDAVAAGDFDGAKTIYEQLLAEDPKHPFAADALRQVNLMQRVEQSGGTDFDKAVAAADGAPGDVELQCTAADLEVANGVYEAAFNRLLHVVRTGDDDTKDRARGRLIELFAIVGDAEPAVRTARQNLASALF
ncbi:putative thioredoxin [Antricoccus suffuscus]|uniref:Putative thioredoxin n=1 Tax=Antricoccus suffuscus TaxID=1629062 RepID=A0A2T1A513_9ACTN|nr:tetratricopeptide repeat protein [Antricoccus suffuscus]PRZ43428.1 putative thioredoxin [Antricoccus suffuscus]